MTAVRGHLRSIDEPLPWLLEDPRAISVTDVVDHLWVRVLDPIAALGARRYGAAGTLELDVADALHHASGRFRAHRRRPRSRRGRAARGHGCRGIRACARARRAGARRHPTSAASARRCSPAPDASRSRSPLARRSPTACSHRSARRISASGSDPRTGERFRKAVSAATPIPGGASESAPRVLRLLASPVTDTSVSYGSVINHFVPHDHICVIMAVPPPRMTAEPPRGRPRSQKGRAVKTPSLVSTAALVGVSALLLAGCSSGGSGGETGDAEAATRACVILPDAASSPRWENNDRPYLEEGLEAAGFEADIQNAQGDANKYATIADQQLSQGLRRDAARRLQRRGCRRRREGQGRGHPGHRLRPSDRGRRLLRVVRQRRGRPARGPVDRRRPRRRRQGPGDRDGRLHGR